ncbi:glycosyl transferase family 2, partial [Cytobacillus oceanisediminis]
MLKVSVIVPFYNVEDYLEQALDSLKHQTLKEIEVIMINDGSSDRSLKIAEKYAREYKNFQLVNCKKKRGPGFVRNIGLRQAKGKYIGFLDADDFYEKTTCETLFYIAEKHKVDIAVGNVRQFQNDNFFLSGLHKKAFKNHLKTTSIQKDSDLLYDTSVWNKIYRRKFIVENEIEFNEDILYEDIPFSIEAYLKAKNVYVTLEYIYNWRIRQDDNNLSITQQRLEQQNFTDRINAIKRTNSLISNYSESKTLYYKFQYKVLEHDFPLYINLLSEMNED